MYLMQISLVAVLLAVASCGSTQGSQTSPPPNVPISIDAARQTALARVAGQVQEEELEEEDGRWVYEFDIKPSDAASPVQEVVVDANSGQIIKVEADD